MQPAHMARGIVQRDEVVQRRVDRARAETVGDRPQAELDGRAAERKAEERRGRHGHADRRDQRGAEAPGHPLGQKARDDGPGGDDHGDHACERELRAEIQTHDRPCGAEQRIGQTQADKGQVYDRKQERKHKNLEERRYRAGLYQIKHKKARVCLPAYPCEKDQLSQS